MVDRATSHLAPRIVHRANRAVRGCSCHVDTGSRLDALTRTHTYSHCRGNADQDGHFCVHRHSNADQDGHFHAYPHSNADQDGHFRAHPHACAHEHVNAQRHADTRTHVDNAQTIALCLYSAHG